MLGKVLLCSLVSSFTIVQALGQALANIQPPPNTIKLTDSVYLDKTEVANIHWLEFLYYAKRDSSALAYNKLLPDNSVWNEVNIEAKNYLNNPAYRYNPVVGITYLQAVAYCKWRSRVVTNRINSSDSLRQLNNLATGDSLIIKYRLPTETEWEQAAYGGLPPTENPYGIQPGFLPLPRSWRAKDLYSSRLDTSLTYSVFKRKLKAIRKTPVLPAFACLTKVAGLFAFYYDMPHPINQQPVNNYGFYNMVGNVAEMIDKPGVAKGGSYLHSAKACQIPDRQLYHEARAWLGFRCIAQVYIIKRQKLNNPNK